MQSAILNDNFDLNYQQNNVVITLTHMKKSCNSGFESAVTNDVADLYVQIYIFSKHLSVTLGQERKKS